MHQDFSELLADFNAHSVKDPRRNKVSNNEGAAAPRQQGARRENTLLYSTDE